MISGNTFRSNNSSYWNILRLSSVGLHSPASDPPTEEILLSDSNTFQVISALSKSLHLCSESSRFHHTMVEVGWISSFKAYACTSICTCLKDRMLFQMMAFHVVLQQSKQVKGEVLWLQEGGGVRQGRCYGLAVLSKTHVEIELPL
jgi:hypothetical protein